MNRTLDIVRIHLVDRRIVLGTALAVVLAVAVMVALSEVFGPEVSTNGLLGGLYAGLAAAQVQTMSRLLPFLLCMGATRRVVYAGTLLFVLAETALVGALLLVARTVEQLTGGWGTGLSTVGSAWLAAGDPFTQWIVYVAPFLAVFPLVLLGSAVAARWGWGGLATGAVLAGAAALAVAIGLPPLLAGLIGLPAAFAVAVPVAIGILFTGAGWFVVRGVTP